MPSLRSVSFGGLLLLAGALVFQACGKQSEGMRCEELNGVTGGDCENGLECVQRVCCNDKICCPAGGPQNGTTAECRGAATTPSDSGVVDISVPETTAADTTPSDTGTVIEVGDETLVTTDAADAD